MLKKRKIDLNADVGESLYETLIGEDETLIPLLSSANIACGFHGGDPLTILRAIELAIQHGVRIGAHPSYDDRASGARDDRASSAHATGKTAFGREERNAPPEQISAQLEYQLAAIKGLAAARSAAISHIKLHGALYHRVSRDPAAASVALGAFRKILPDAAVVAQAGSIFAALAQAEGFKVLAEAFADRRYLADGSLAPRKHPSAVLSTPEAIAEQALAIARDRAVRAETGALIPIEADTLCLHGDHPGATAAAREIHKRFATAGIGIG